MLGYFLLIFLAIIFGILFLEKNSELKKLKKYISLVENDVLKEQLKHEEFFQITRQHNHIPFQTPIDSLTSLPTLNVFYDRVIQTVYLSKRFSKAFGVMFFQIRDLNELKEKYPAEFILKLLSEIGRRLQNSIRQIDTVSYYDTNIFILLTCI